MVDEIVEKSMVTEAVEAAIRLEKANAIQAENIKKLEAIEARRILGGQSAAGQPQEKVVEETPKEYAERMLRGGK